MLSISNRRHSGCRDVFLKQASPSACPVMAEESIFDSVHERHNSEIGLISART
jgi:hypothetical protein